MFYGRSTLSGGPAHARQDGDMHPVGRRGVVLGGLAGAAVAASADPSASSTTGAARRGPRVLVVGAGLAGLTTAYRLRSSTDWQVDVHDARDRVGGRTHTVRDLPGGLYCEAGGSFISTGDVSIRAIARELDVPLVDLDPIWPRGGYAYQFDGAARTTCRGLPRAPATVPGQAERQFRHLPWPIRYGAHDPDAVRLDRMTVAEWIERHVDAAGVRSTATGCAPTSRPTTPRRWRRRAP